MPFEKNFAINVMYPAASSAYTIMTVPQPPLVIPAGYTVVGPILADPTLAAPMMAQAHPDQQRMAHKAVQESSIFGFVAWAAGSKTAIVAIRGTQNIVEWLADFDAPALPYFHDPSAGLAHMGFQLVYENIRSSIRQLIATGCPGVQELWITGHSLGAALAVLCAYDALKTFGLGITPKLCTFAGPRVGDSTFEGKFNAAFHTCARIVNFMDVVPQVPLPPLYQHVGEEILVRGGFKPLDVGYAHYLTTYLTGLQAL